jgi:hypothetical protein
MHPWIKSLAAGTVLTLCLAGQAEAGVVVFADDFESTVNTRNWQVYQDVSSGQWATTQGTGIEVQTSGTVVAAQSGNQYIELDSSRSRGGAGDASLTNSAMTVTLTDLDAGDYLLNYFYQPRTNTADDNIIGVYFDEGDDPLFSTLVDTANGVGADGWVGVSVGRGTRRDAADFIPCRGDPEFAGRVRRYGQPELHGQSRQRAGTAGAGLYRPGRAGVCGTSPPPRVMPFTPQHLPPHDTPPACPSA